LLPAPPPLDHDGNVIPHDHPDILDEDGIIRGVSAQHLVDDPKVVGRRRISSVLFNPSSGKNGGLSVDLLRPMVEAGIDPAERLTSRRWLGALLLKARDFRKEKLKVGYHPLPHNSFHGEVWGNFSDGCKRRLLTIAESLVPVPGVKQPPVASQH
jgi:hypothetical protein